MNPKIPKLRAALAKNRARTAKLQAVGRELERHLKELEDTDIVGMVREEGLTLEQFAELFQRMKDSPLPSVPPAKPGKKEEQNHEKP